MIPVQPQPEPPSFDERVRKPGQEFLARLNRVPTHKDFRKNWYWNRVSSELYSAYNQICAYSANWIPENTKSIDHFIPRQVSPDLAYEWSNYRLANERLGNYKDNSQTVLDPFVVQSDWFVLDFNILQIVPNQSLSRELQKSINDTIQKLRLNRDNNLVSTRLEVLRAFADGSLPMEFLERRYPFIAYELRRQRMGQAILKNILDKQPSSS